jgi:hypothetical protein
VAVVTCGDGNKDNKDLNDVYRRGLLGPERIADLLAEHHMSGTDTEKAAS